MSRGDALIAAIAATIVVFIVIGVLCALPHYFGFVGWLLDLAIGCVFLFYNTLVD